MSEKEHQSSRTEHQIRVDGKPVRYHFNVNEECIDDWLDFCKKNPDCYVDIVTVRTQIVINQYNYNRMKKHFDK